MSHDISDSFIDEFDTNVKQTYQEMGSKLRPYVYRREGVIGKSVDFPVYGAGFAQDAPTGGELATTMGTSSSNVTATLVDKQASEYSNIFENEKVNFDDQQQLVKVIAKALGRTEDQTVIDALEAVTYVDEENSVAITFGDGVTDTGLTVAKIIQAGMLLDDAGVPEDERVFVAPAKAKSQLLRSTEVTSSDFVEVKALTSGTVDTFMGFKFCWIADTYNTDADTWYGLPGGGTTVRKCYAFHQDAPALAVGKLDKQVRIDYMANRFSYFVAAPLSTGAVVRDEKGVIEVNVDTSVIS